MLIEIFSCSCFSQLGLTNCVKVYGRFSPVQARAMATVKGSTQYQMMVVPHRPFYRAVTFMALLGALGIFFWFIFHYGKNEGMALKVEWVKERDNIREELIRSNSLIDEMRQEIALLKVDGVIDDKANEEVRQTIESLQEVNAELNEEVSFYKGVMAPNFAKKGLRIEKLDMAADSERSVKYSLLLTQVVDTHHWLQGEVEISVRGQYGIEEKSLVLSELDKGKADAVRFRFRYFQNINGKMTLPEGFEPREVMIVAQSSGGKQRLEKGFDWPLSGG